MNRPKNQFYSSPSSTLTHFRKTSEISQISARSISLNWEMGKIEFAAAASNDKLQDAIKENYDKKIKALSTEVAGLEKQGKSQDEIKTALKEKRAKIIQDSFNEALKTLKINKTENGKEVPVTYMEIVNDSSAKDQVKEIYGKYLKTIDADVDKAVDDYFNQKAVASGHAKGALASVPSPTARQDLDSPNPEIQRLQEMQAAREQVKDTSRKERGEIMNPESSRYLAITQDLDKLTSPDGGTIKDYDDGYNPFDGIQDENAPTRMRLNGYLYASYIFNGGGEAGRAAVDESIKIPYEHYHVTLGWSRLTMEDLEKKMGLKQYFDMAKDYSTFDRPIGLMASMLQLIDQNIKDPDQHQIYKEYVTGKFNEIKSGPAANNEEQQLQLLFSIKSFPEFIQVDPSWKKTFKSIDQFTDSDPSGAKISDYEGKDKNSPTRLQLNGYLYSVYLFSGKNNAAMEAKMDQAAKIYDNSRSWSHPTKMFTQELFESNFNLGSFLRRVNGYSKSENVKGAMAGLLQQADSQKPEYKKYVEEIVEGTSKIDGEESQLMQLSTIVSPANYEKYAKEKMRDGFFNLIIAATQQHNQFKFSDDISKTFESDKTVLTSDQYEEKSKAARAEIETFIKARSDAEMKSLSDKYKVLEGNNKLLKPAPLFPDADLVILKKAIADDNKQFEAARLVTQSQSLKSAVVEKYLEKLTTAEKTYFNISSDLDSKLQAVADQGSGKVAPPDTTNADGGSNESGSESSENGPEVDPYTESWPNAERVTPYLADYSGTLIANSSDPNVKVPAYSFKGKKVATLDNDSKVTRTAADSAILAYRVEGLNFIRVTYNGKKMWIPEEELSYEDQPETKPEPKPKSAAETAAEQLKPETDNYTDAWPAGDTVDSTLQGQTGVYEVNSRDGANLNLRNEKGEIIYKVPTATTLQRNADDVALRARRVNNVSFVQMTYNSKKVWLAENLLTSKG